jgi:hypothetical protein
MGSYLGLLRWRERAFLAMSLERIISGCSRNRVCQERRLYRACGNEYPKLVEKAVGKDAEIQWLRERCALLDSLRGVALRHRYINEGRMLANMVGRKHRRR